MKIIIFGPQGSGKSTQGKLLAEYLKIPFISTGDIFREKTLEDSDNGRKIKAILDAGQLVDDQTTTKVVEERLQREDVEDGYILDGYPRTQDQVKLFKNPNLKPDIVISIDVPEEVVVERLMSRGRADDTPELIKTRINLYKQNSSKVLQSLQEFGRLINIEGQGSVEEVQQRMRAVLNG